MNIEWLKNKTKEKFYPVTNAKAVLIGELGETVDDEIAELENQVTGLQNDLGGKAPNVHTHTKSDITDFPTSMPASDVSAWAKEETKPTYTKSEVGLSNVENKSSETIRSEITSSNITNALGYTPTKQSDIDNAVDGIEIGGRNLLVGTKDFSGDWDNKEYWSVSSETYKGFTVMSRTSSWSGLSQPVEGVVGETYTFSGYVKKTGGITYVFTDGFGGTTTNHGTKIGTKINEWEHFNVTTTVSTSGSLGFRVENNSNETTYVCGLKLEKGNKATDWTPAPEDIEAEIQAVDNKLTTNLLKPTLETTTQNGVTCTNNGDGTYTLNGTASDNTVFIVIGGNDLRKAFNQKEELKLFGTPDGATSPGYYMQLWVSNVTTYIDAGKGVIIKNPNDNDCNVAIMISKNTTISNAVFKPMLTTNLNATYDDFVPYTGDTGQLNSDVAEVRKDFDEHTHEIADVTGLQSALDGKLDKFTAGGIDICYGGGKYIYFKIATIKITAYYINRPVVFEMSGRGRGLSLVTIMFSSIADTDPALSFFTSNCDNCFWIKKTTTSTWEVYGQYNEPYGDYVLHRITGAGADIGVTVNMTSIDSLPSGCTQVAYGGNVNYANTATSATKATQDESGNNIKSSYASSIDISDHTITLKNKNEESLGTVTVPDTDTWRPLGTTADTACAGNDSRLSNARPASDVYAWAKASSKPSYSYSEISGTPSSLPANGGNASTVNGHTVNSDVPANAKFTDTDTWRPQPDWNATSGDAAIKNKPTIPTVGNGTITITQNGTTKGTFTTNQSGNTTIELTDTDTNTTYGVATTSANGLMSTDMVTKLNGIATNADRIHIRSQTLGSMTLQGNYDGYAPQFLIPIHDDASPIGIIPRSSGSADVCWIDCYLDSNNKTVVKLKNTVPNTKTFDPSVNVIYKNG